MLAGYPKRLPDCGNHAAVGPGHFHHVVLGTHVESGWPHEQQTVLRPGILRRVNVGYSQTVARKRQFAIDVPIAAIDEKRLIVPREHERLSGRSWVVSWCRSRCDRVHSRHELPDRRSRAVGIMATGRRERNHRQRKEQTPERLPTLRVHFGRRTNLPTNQCPVTTPRSQFN